MEAQLSVTGCGCGHVSPGVLGVHGAQIPPCPVREGSWPELHASVKFHRSGFPSPHLGYKEGASPGAWVGKSDGSHISTH